MNNIKKQNYNVTRKMRNRLNEHNSFIIWFTGLSGSGKSTLANKIEIELHKKGVKTYVLDGDNIRGGLNSDLSFEPNDRTENIRRIGEVGNLMLDAGLIVLTAFVSPYKKDRETVKSVVKDVNFVEVFVRASIEECKKRDVKGLYQKAEKGLIKNMTGISSPYETPESPDIVVDTEFQSLQESVDQIMNYITPRLLLKNE